MGKGFKLFVYIIVIISLICLINKLGILDVFFSKVTEEQLESYYGYYYNMLEQDEKEMYVRIDEAVKKRKENVFLGTVKEDDVTDKATRVFTAYFNDNPRCYYVSSEYFVAIKNYIAFKHLSVKLTYITDNEEEIEEKNEKLEAAIDKIIKENITNDMTDFEKEVRLHDALVKHVKYYNYEDIKSIPDIKHTAYSALVEKEAVCDGYTKAFKILLEEVGIDCIVVNGTADNVAHAWNLVSLEDEYYHVDVTSDKLEEGTKKFPIHRYFNLTDEEVLKTHTVEDLFELPTCDQRKYNYYFQTGYYIDYEDELYSKLERVIQSQKASNILEIKLDPKRSLSKVLDVLYYLNFNNWKTTGTTNVIYSKVEDVYVFVK